MRTTLEIDDEILTNAKRLAQQRGLTLGQVMSDLARQSLARTGKRKFRNGVEIFVPNTNTQKPDLHLVNALRDQS